MKHNGSVCHLYYRETQFRQERDPAYRYTSSLRNVIRKVLSFP